MTDLRTDCFVKKEVQGPETGFLQVKPETSKNQTDNQTPNDCFEKPGGKPYQNLIEFLGCGFKNPNQKR